jgi:hypothetical protein
VRRFLLVIFGTLVLVVAGCGGGSKKPASVPEGPPPLERVESGNVILYVSNQSFERDKVDIRILIDGRPAVDEDFAVGNEHNWVEFRFSLEDGEHVLRAHSRDGEALLEERFEVAGKRWAVVDYWCCSDESEPKFTFSVSAKPIAFA